MNLGVIEGAGPRASFAKIRGATKIRILFLYWDSQEEENRPSEKLHLTLKVWRKEEATPAITATSWLQFLLGNLYKHAS
jgi:hypothetical protein